jgi:uncharacterized membrane protein
LTDQAISAILGAAETAGKPAALIFYLLFVVGILASAILPGLDAGPLKTALLRAGLFGLIAYGTYELMNPEGLAGDGHRRRPGPGNGLGVAVSLAGKCLRL